MTTATSRSPVGTYPIIVRQGSLSARNYTFVLSPATLRITKVPVTLSKPVRRAFHSHGKDMVAFRTVARNAVSHRTLAGLTVTFTARDHGRVVFRCTATTNRYGVARCTARQRTTTPPRYPLPYTVTSAPTSHYAPGARF